MSKALRITGAMSGVIVLGVLAGCAASGLRRSQRDAQLIQAAKDVASSAVATAEGTKVKLPSGRTLSLSGSWKGADRMWPDAALVFPGGYVGNGGVSVICAGELGPRQIYREPRGNWQEHTKGFVFSNDGATCFAWLDNTRQLTAINMKDGSMKSLLKFPTLKPNYDSPTYTDPDPVVGAHVLFQVGSNLLLLLQRERSGEGRYQLVSIPQEGVKRLDLKAIPWLPGAVESWDLARSRQEIYLLVVQSYPATTGTLMVRRLDGTPVDKLGQRVRNFLTRMALSPDERWLLVQHRDNRDDPLDAPPRGPVARRGSLASVNEALGADRTCICLLSLVNDEAIEIAGGAYYGSWAPDSQSVTYLRNWELWRLNLSDLKEERIAWRQPSRKGHPIYPEAPTWSVDGKHLVVCLGEDADYGDLDGFQSIPSLLLDFPRHEYIIVSTFLNGAVWSPVPRPFLEK